MTAKPTIEFFGLSDIGLIRPNNEDVIAALPSHRFYTIADGMGGHKAGEIAAKEAVNELITSAVEFLSPPKENVLTQKEIIKSIEMAIAKANHRVYSLGQDNESFKGMGTTMCLLYFNKNYVTYAHVGDSRIYLFRNNNLLQLTKDHSLIEKLQKQRKIKKNDFIPKNYKNIITKAIGISLNIAPDIKYKKILPNDRFFMCTDGLSDYLPENEIISILKEKLSIKHLVKKLIEAAKNKGSRDNISTMLIDVIK